VALGSTGHIAAVTVATIVAKDLLGSDALAGLPGATVVLGAAAGSLLLSSLMARSGRRPGLVAGYAIGVLGALIATAAILMRSFPLLLVGTGLIGFGNSANQLSRYASADMAPRERHASAIGIVVWGATVGSVIGPWLVPIATAMAAGAGLPGLSGPYLVPVVFVGAAALLSFALLRPDPYELADASEEAEASQDAADHDPVRAILRRPAIVAALVVLVIGQITMTLIMTMTPLHMTEHGHDLAAVGMVLSGHTLGMYAFSPVSGWLTDRTGRLPTIYLGAAILAVSAVMTIVAPPEGGIILPAGMFLLGLGWSFSYVGGSALLSDHLELHERTKVQGVADAMIWSAAAAASLGSGLVVAAAGYAALGVLGLGLVGIAVAVIARTRRAALAAGVAQS
jgi:MFS family permease